MDPTQQYLLCPRCGLALFVGQAVDLTMHACGRCGGIWLDPDGAARVRLYVSADALDLAQKATDHGTQPVDVQPVAACPVCRVALRRSRFALAAIDTDSCDRHGTWYDRAELLHIVEAVRRHRSSPAALLPIPPDTDLDAASRPARHFYAMRRDPNDLRTHRDYSDASDFFEAVFDFIGTVFDSMESSSPSSWSPPDFSSFDD
jgi:Zn-finger nucleic acid-binding protein